MSQPPTQPLLAHFSVQWAGLVSLLPEHRLALITAAATGQFPVNDVPGREHCDMTRVAVSPNVLRWARERAGLGLADLQHKFPKLADWENASIQPTMRQLQDFARSTRAPYGFMFLPEPPDLGLHFADFRTVESRRPQGISPDLMDTVHLMLRRQAWLREERIEAEARPVAFVGAASLSGDPATVARHMRRALGLVDGWAKRVPTWTSAVGELRRVVEAAGVMAVINGIVGNDTHRKLEVDEFRGFALSDPHAPLIFVNGADAKSAQMFTLAHELAHLWLGDEGEGLSGFDGLQPGGGKVECFCDQVAAEFLVPSVEIRTAWRSVADSEAPMKRLARYFKVSPVVIGRRAMDLGLMECDEFHRFYNNYTQREFRSGRATGGDLYNNQDNRVGRLFASHVIRAAKDGRIGFKEAYDLTGLHGGTFQKYASKLNITLP